MQNNKNKNKTKKSQLDSKIEAALPCWMATERRWTKLQVANGSPECRVIRLPRFLMKRSDLNSKAPIVSIAIGKNLYNVESRALYLDIFLDSAKAATAPGSLAAADL